MAIDLNIAPGEREEDEPPLHEEVHLAHHLNLNIAPGTSASFFHSTNPLIHTHVYHVATIVRID